MEFAFLSIPIIVYINAFLTGVFTKLADIANDDEFKVSKSSNLFFGVLWGIFGSLVVLGNADVAAFYLGILLSWIHRYKLDNYSHGIGGTIILATIFFIHPVLKIQIIITLVTFILFTTFGLLTRHGILKKRFFVNYNIYSFIFLIGISLIYSNIWIVVFASLANVIGYQGVKKWWIKKQQK